MPIGRNGLAGAHYLPSKISSYLHRLYLEYARANNVQLQEIVRNALVAVIEETVFDNLDGGTYGHDVVLFLSPEILRSIPLANQKEICVQIREGLNTCAGSFSNEFVNEVNLELPDEADPYFQRAVSFFARPQTNPDSLSIWKAGYLRLFMSHRDEFKEEARCLADELIHYGVSAFVAHDTIEPMTTWQHEILKGLETMEVMLAFVTDDFHESTWTNQEVGYALGKGIPIISLKLQGKDPAGFIGSEQAMRGSLDDPAASASGISRLIANKLRGKDRIQEILISAFLDSQSFLETQKRFDRMAKVAESLSEDQLSRIIEGFRENSQLYKCFHITDENKRLIKFLERCTDYTFTKRDKVIDYSIVSVADDIPF